ncbi:hevein-like preproprotein [Hibiscus syriacus]|uniref:hevein-like preproprotein n=1 Tax=Hibiscus syriacus TaxID=106335 RepID=UPI001921C0A4|nr:hevein-like preproprotein [Hibiscus syriacus]
MERSVIRFILISCIVMLGWAIGSSMAAEDATAYWTDYKVIENDWSPKKVGVYCSQFPEYAYETFEWRSKYYWTAFCGPEIPNHNQDVTNCQWKKRDGESAGYMHQPSLDLDYPAFLRSWMTKECKTGILQ